MSEPVTCQYGHTHPMLVWGECQTCQGDRNRRTADVMAARIREAKDDLADAHGNSVRLAEVERETLKALGSLGHPDPVGFVKAVIARLDAAPAKRGRGAR